MIDRGEAVTNSRYRVQVIDQGRNLVLVDATVVGPHPVQDIIQSALENTDMNGALRITVDQLQSLLS